MLKIAFLAVLWIAIAVVVALAIGRAADRRDEEDR